MPQFTTALSGTTYKVNHPARDQLDAMVEVQSACPEDIYKALEAASVAQPAWKSSLRSERLRSLGRLLQEFKADIVEVIIFRSRTRSRRLTTCFPCGDS
jgi:delta 1-pyrroline-5-carboxylate dehydrogenase